MVKLNTIRYVLSIVASENLYLEQLDVKTAFLHGDLNEEIYMHQPEGFSEEVKENMVCRLKKSLYGLKQAPRQWYMKFESFMHKEGFQIAMLTIVASSSDISQVISFCYFMLMIC